jgi:hypothetical protein
MRFAPQTYVIVRRYSLSSGIQGLSHSPFLKNWELWGLVNREWRPLDKRSTSTVLSDGKVHTFDVTGECQGIPIEAVRLCQTGRNGLGTSQMHITSFVLTGDVLGPPEMIGCEDERIDCRCDSGSVNVSVPGMATQGPVSEPPTIPSCGQTAAKETSEDPKTNSKEDSDDRPGSVVETRPDGSPPDRVPTELPSADSAVDPKVAEQSSDRGNPPHVPLSVIVNDQIQEEPPLTSDKKQPQSQKPPDVVVDETLLLPESAASVDKISRTLIDDMASLVDVKDIGASRFGAVRLVQGRKPNGTVEQFAAKYYNAGDSREGPQAFHDLMRPLVDLSHPHVMPIVGIISPTKGVGPIIVTPYSPLGSLDDVLHRVRLNDPPLPWNDCTKFRMIVSLVSGLIYLHDNGIVHRELKPRDLIVERDGSLRICGYVTSILEEHRFTRASQVAGLWYIAPEIYEDISNDARIRDPKRDVFSFGLIVYELLFGSRVFPSSISPAVIMRRSRSALPSDRPKIPNDVHPVLREMIMRCWVALAAQRPSMDDLWKRMREVGFRLFPCLEVKFVPHT